MPLKEELQKTLDDMVPSVLARAQEWAEAAVAEEENRSGVKYHSRVLRAAEVRKLRAAFSEGYMEAMKSVVKDSVMIMEAFKA